ncbi:MAG: hypothetical protein ACYTG2_15745 [Planctomycetota bacterium]
MLLCCAPLLAGLACVSGQQISSHAIDYNRAVAQARDEMLLLNVMRSRDRRPMVFTGLSRITGSLRSEQSFGADANVGPDASDQLGLDAGMRMTDAPSFDVAILDSQEFTRGIMTPLSPKVIEYYWDQGYNREVLLYLCVERIEFVGDTRDPEAVHELVNEPGEPSFPLFQQLVYSIVDEGRFEADPHEAEDIGPAVSAAKAADLSTLVRVADSGLSLDPTASGEWQLSRPALEPRLRVPHWGGLVSGAAGDGTRGNTDGSLYLYATTSAFERASVDSPGEPKGRMVLRSPQAVLYFIGELTRPGKQLALREKRPGQPLAERMLFVVRNAATCGPGLVRVDYDGEPWVIPDGEGECHPGRSMQALAFAGQLLSLQQSARDLPATGTVRIIGP